MPALPVSPPYKLFTDIDGNPLESGYIYIGIAGLNPEVSPISVYWDAELTVPAAQPIRTVGGYASRNGAAADIYVSAVDYSIIVKNKNSTLVYSRLYNSLIQNVSYTIDPIMYGAAADGVSDDIIPIREAIDAAKELVDVGPISGATFYSNVVDVDLLGRTYLVSDTVSLTSKGGVRLVNGFIEASATGWAGTTATPVIEIGDGVAGPADSRRAGLDNVSVECNHVSMGIDHNQADGITMSDVSVHGFKNYGLRIRGKATGSYYDHVTCNEWFFAETGRELKANRTAIGISVEVGDIHLHACSAFYCLIPMDITSTVGRVTFTGANPFNGSLDDLTSHEIVGVTDNGSGFVRIEVADTSTITTGDEYIIPWLPGVSSTTGSSGGVYLLTVIDATHVDVDGYIFTTGPYAPSGTQSIYLYADEQVAVNVSETASNVSFSDSRFGNGKVVIGAGAEVSFNHSLANRTASGNNQTAFELVSTIASSDCSKVLITACKHDTSLFRLVESGVGTFASRLRCLIHNNKYSNGNTSPSLGKIAFDDGTAVSPAIVFSGAQTSDDGFGGATIDGDTGFFHPAENEIAIANGGIETERWTADNEVVTGYTVSVPMPGTVKPLKQVHGTGGSASSGIARWSNDATGPSIIFAKSRGAAIGTYSALQSGDQLGRVIFGGDNGTDITNIGARIAASATGAWGALYPAQIEFQTTNLANNTIVTRYTADNVKFAPLADNAYTLGAAANRWSEVFAANGTINTSDERQKTEIVGIPDAVLDAWAEVPKRMYRWIDAVAEKGDQARWHFGVIAQDIVTAFANNGLDAHDYGVLCYDEWEDQEIVVGETEDGEQITDIVPAGNRYGVRYSQAAVLDAVLDARERAKLEARIVTLGG